MINTITNERALPAPDAREYIPAKGLTFEYVRHLIDPRVMIACRSGDCYAREDGQKWKHSGWKVTRYEDGRVEHEMGAAKDDLKVFEYADAVAA
jgi:hypothetical protein